MYSFDGTFWSTIFTYGQTYDGFVQILSYDRPLYLSLIVCILFPWWVNWNSHYVYFIPMLEFPLCIFHSHRVYFIPMLGKLEFLLYIFIPIMGIFKFPLCIFHSHADFVGIPIV